MYSRTFKSLIFYVNRWLTKCTIFLNFRLHSWNDISIFNLGFYHLVYVTPTKKHCYVIIFKNILISTTRQGKYTIFGFTKLVESSLSLCKKDKIDLLNIIWLTINHKNNISWIRLGNECLQLWFMNIITGISPSV